MSFADFVNQLLQFSTQLIVLWQHHLLLYILLLFVPVITHRYREAQAQGDTLKKPNSPSCFSWNDYLTERNYWRSNFPLTFFGHANLKALLQPTVLAAVAGDFVDLTVLVSVAGIHHVLLDTAPKETLEMMKDNFLYNVFWQDNSHSVRSPKIVLSHARSMFLGMAMSVCQWVHCFGPDWNI